MKTIKSQKIKLKTKRVFLKKGTCSRAFFYILNREFGHPLDHEEQAIDPLAGGIVQQGYQCGLLWGAVMALGAESNRRNSNLNDTIAQTIIATKHMLESFTKRAKSIECEDITKTDFTNKLSFAKYMVTGKFVSCFVLAGKWAPEAIDAAKEGLTLDYQYAEKPISCASEVIRKMGGSEEEMAMVAGFAGGLGLSGSGCGALAAAIWKRVLNLVKEDKWKPAISDPTSEKILNYFYEITDYEMQCHKITGQQFASLDEHSTFISKGGCKTLLAALANCKVN